MIEIDTHLHTQTLEYAQVEEYITYAYSMITHCAHVYIYIYIFIFMYYIFMYNIYIFI